MFLRFFLVIILSIIVVKPLSGHAEGNNDKLPVPRFASVRSNEVNVRTGPGVRYPIKWVIVKEDMPVEIIADFEDWRKVRDIKQDEGWVHKSMLSGKRTALVKSNNQKIYFKADKNSKVVAIGNKSSLLKIDNCSGKFCEVEAENVDGFIEQQSLWGIYESEKIKN